MEQTKFSLNESAERVFDFVNAKLEMIERLKEVMGAPKFVEDFPIDRFPVLSEIYRGDLGEGWEGMGEIIGVDMVGMIEKGRQVTEPSDELRKEVREMIDAIRSLDKSEVKAGKKLLEGLSGEELIKMGISEKCMHYRTVAMINTGVAIDELYDKARSGDDNALLELVRIDKSLVTEDWLSERIRRKQVVGDWEFFKRLGRAMGKEPTKCEPSYFRVVMLTHMFWDEFQKFTIEELNEFYVEKGLLPKASDPSNLHKALYRAGLKKYERAR